MTLEIETFESSSGFSATGTGSVVRENEHEDFIAGELSKSLLVQLGATGDTVTKTLSSPLDVSDYEYAVLSVKGSVGYKKRYRATDDYRYRITLDSGVSFDIPVWSWFTQVRLDLSGVLSVSEFTIEKLSGDSEYLILSNLVAVTDVLPLDIYTSLTAKLKQIRDELYPTGEKVGTLTASAGDDRIRVEGLAAYVERYSVVRIEGGGNSEMHMLIANDETEFLLGDLYDGKTLSNSYTGADVYVMLEAEYGILEQQPVFPGMTVWGFDAAPIMRGNPTDYKIQSYRNENDEFYVTRDGKLVEWPVAIDCMAHHYELIGRMGRIVRVAMARRELWVNGWPLEIYFDENANEILPEEGYTDIYHVQFTLNVRVREDTWRVARRAKTTTQNETITPSKS